LVPELEARMCEASGRAEVVAFDHHQSHQSPADGMMVIEEGVSAASVLYQHLHLGGRFKKLVAIADLVEFCRTPTLTEAESCYGAGKVAEEARILDFSWRLDIDDDAFRGMAAMHLSKGVWPSEVGMIRRRYLQVVNEQRWPKALARVEGSLRVRGPVGILHGKDKNRSLYGFGTRALVEVARQKGCSYAVMVNERRQHASVSLRGLEPGGVNLGRFAEEFTHHYGVEGGGHPASAGARIPVEATDLFLRRFVSISSL
jgi:hypothetical protein